VLIDPVIETVERDMQVLASMQLTLKYASMCACSAHAINVPAQSTRIATLTT
jgi:hypothetical protein